MKKVHDGFSLLELMIVLLVLGVVATTALPFLKSGVNLSSLTAATEEVVTALEYARLSALTTGTRSRVIIDPEADTIWVQRFKNTADLMGTETQLPKEDVEGGSFVPMAHPFNRGAEYTTVFSGEDRFVGVNIASCVFGGSNNVTFAPLGTPSSAGTIVLSMGSKQVTVAVDGTIGRVTTSE